MDNESVWIIHDAGLVHDDATTNTPPPHTTASLASSFAVAIPVEETSSSSNVPIMWQQRKQDDKCCGCCCDHRWAVIILSIIRFVILVIASSILIFDIREWSLEIFMMIVYACMSIFSWVGAVKYSICLVAIDLVWCVGKYYRDTMTEVWQWTSLDTIQ